MATIDDSVRVVYSYCGCSSWPTGATGLFLRSLGPCPSACPAEAAGAGTENGPMRAPPSPPTQHPGPLHPPPLATLCLGLAFAGHSMPWSLRCADPMPQTHWHPLNSAPRKQLTAGIAAQAPRPVLAASPRLQPAPRHRLRCPLRRVQAVGPGARKPSSASLVSVPRPHSRGFLWLWLVFDSGCHKRHVHKVSGHPLK